MARPAIDEAQQAELRAAVQELLAMAVIELANWIWRAVHQFFLERFGIVLSRSGCLNYLHRLGGLPSSGLRSVCSRLMGPSGSPSWRSTPH